MIKEKKVLKKVLKVISNCPKVQPVNVIVPFRLTCH